MKKIIFSVLAIAMAIGVTTTAAYALFFSTVQVSGITFTTGNADLSVTDYGTVPDLSVDTPEYAGAMNAKLGNLYPGFRDYTLVDFKNTSSSNIGLKLKMQLTSAGGNWSTLKDKVYMAITAKDTLPTGGDWKTLAQWNAAPVEFGSVLAHDDTKVTYRVSFAVDDNADNSISNKSLSPITFVFTGTQN